MLRGLLVSHQLQMSTLPAWEKVSSPKMLELFSSSRGSRDEMMEVQSLPPESSILERKRKFEGKRWHFFVVCKCSHKITRKREQQSMASVHVCAGVFHAKKVRETKRYKRVDNGLFSSLWEIRWEGRRSLPRQQAGRERGRGEGFEGGDPWELGRKIGQCLQENRQWSSLPTQVVRQSSRPSRMHASAWCACSKSQSMVGRPMCSEEEVEEGKFPTQARQIVLGHVTHTHTVKCLPLFSHCLTPLTPIYHFLHLKNVISHCPFFKMRAGGMLDIQMGWGVLLFLQSLI